MFKSKSNSKLIKDSAIYTFSNIINAGIPFLLLPVLTRYLTSADYGITATFQVLVGFFTPIIGLNVQTSITRKYFDRDKIDFGQYVGNCLIILLLSTLAILLIFLPASGAIGRFADFPSDWLWGVILVAFSQFLISIGLGLWQVTGKAIPYSIFQNSQALITILFSVFLIVSLGMDWRGRIISQLATSALFGVLVTFFIFKMKVPFPKFNKEYILDALKFGMPLIPYTFTGWIMLATDRILLNKLVGLETTGIYSVAYQICMIIMLVQVSFNNAWVPWIYEKIQLNDKSVNRRIVIFSYLYIAINFIMAFLLYFTGPFFLKFFLGKEFLESTNYLLWLALAQAANGIHFISVSYVLFKNKNIYLTYAAIITAVIHIPITYFLIKVNGAIGAAQALFVSNLLTSLFTFSLAMKFHKMPWALKTQPAA